MMIRTCFFNVCFNFFTNQLWQHLISYNSFRNMNMCLLEVTMCEKCRSSHFQLEGGVKSLRTGGVVRTGELPILWDYFCCEGGGDGVSTPLHAMFSLLDDFWASLLWFSFSSSAIIMLLQHCKYCMYHHGLYVFLLVYFCLILEKPIFTDFVIFIFQEFFIELVL